MGTSFVAAGNISIDDLVFVDGTTKWCVPGGNSIYSALGMAIWGERPAVVAPVGPEYPVGELENRIDLSRCRALPQTLRNWGLYEEDGSRTFIFRAGTRNWADFSPVAGDFDGFAGGCAHIAPLRWSQQAEFTELLRSRGARLVSVDPDDRYLNELSRTEVLRLLKAIDLFLPSKQDTDALLPGKSPLDAMRALRELVPAMPLIAVKCGANGVLMHAAGDADYFCVPAIAEAIVDATGAGDAFAGGTLVGFAHTGSALEAVLQGSVSASFAVAEFGPFGLVQAEAGEEQKRLEALRGRVDAHPF